MSDRVLAAQRRLLLSHPAGWIATGFGSGFSPIAPGTAGSLAALVPWLALRELPLPWYAAALALAFLAGVWACAWLVKTVRLSDPSIAVWDEFTGMWIALAPLAGYEAHSGAGASLGQWLWILFSFLLFRFFDIAKPWPVSWADRSIAGGLGVMVDDVLAGAYAAAVLYLALRWF